MFNKFNFRKNSDNFIISYYTVDIKCFVKGMISNDNKGEYIYYFLYLLICQIFDFNIARIFLSLFVVLHKEEFYSKTR